MAALHQQCFAKPRPWSAAEFTALLDSPNVFLCSEAHGFLLGRIAGPEAELLTLAVSPQHRRTGMASRLLVQFEKTAGTSDVENLFLEVAADNQAAIRLYQSFGFSTAGFRKDYYRDKGGETAHALVLRKDLAAK